MQGRWGVAGSLRPGGDASWRMRGQRRAEMAKTAAEHLESQSYRRPHGWQGLWGAMHAYTLSCLPAGQSQPPLPLPPCQGKEATPGGCTVHRPHTAQLPRWSPGSPAALGMLLHTPGTLLAGSPWRGAHPSQCCSHPPPPGFDVRCWLHAVIHSVTWAPCHESCRVQES